MPEFYETAKSYPEKMPAASINADGAPIPSVGPRQSQFTLPVTEDGLRQTGYMHAGKALVEMDRMLLCVEALPKMKRPTKRLLKLLEELDALRDDIVHEKKGEKKK